MLEHLIQYILFICISGISILPHKTFVNFPYVKFYIVKLAFPILDDDVVSSL